jgi:hypothetical protein
VASRDDARVVRVTPDGTGGVDETDMEVQLLPDAEVGEDDHHESYGVSEMRALRAGRHRFD